MSTVKGPSAPSQATAKGDATARALLEAAIGCLVERGYARTTTAEISRRAGVSPGLFVRYFPTKAALLAAAAGYAHRRSLAGFEQRWDAVTAESADDLARVRAAVGVIVDLFSEPEVRCLSELAVAARTDAELAASLADVINTIDALVLRSAHHLAPAALDGVDLERNVRLVLDCARGVAVRTAFEMPERAAVIRAEASASLVDVLASTRRVDAGSEHAGVDPRRGGDPSRPVA